MAAMIAEEPVRLAAGPGVTLEGRLARPDEARGAVVICHPHPLYGGDMENPVVVRAAEVCASAGLAALRFNFRGVGGSTGTHDGGAGERDDVRAALAAARTAAPGLLALAGYSFGASVAARVAAATPDLHGLCLVAPPLAAMPDLAAGLPAFAGPLHVIAGSGDEYCPATALERLAGELPRARVTTVAGGGHFFFGKLYPLGEAVAAWARDVLALHAGQARGGGGAG